MIASSLAIRDPISFAPAILSYKMNIGHQFMKYGISWDEIKIRSLRDNNVNAQCNRFIETQFQYLLWSLLKSFDWDFKKIHGVRKNYRFRWYTAEKRPWVHAALISDFVITCSVLHHAWMKWHEAWFNKTTSQIIKQWKFSNLLYLDGTNETGKRSSSKRFLARVWYLLASTDENISHA